MSSVAMLSSAACHVPIRNLSEGYPRMSSPDGSRSVALKALWTSGVAIRRAGSSLVQQGSLRTSGGAGRHGVGSGRERKRGVRVQVEEGGILPDLGKLETDQSTATFLKTVSLNEEVKTSGVLLFVYPKADTSGCTKQACGFNDARETFAEAGYKIFGISADIPSAQAAWKEKQNYNFTLLSDPLHKALKALGVSDGSKITRSHLLIEKGGKLRNVSIGISSGDSVPEALKAVGKGVAKGSFMDA